MQRREWKKKRTQTGLENITDGIEDSKVPVVAAVCLITTEESSPLDVGHGHTATIAHKVAREHRRRERVVVVCARAALQCLFALLSRRAVSETQDVRAVCRHRHTQLFSALELCRHLFFSLFPCSLRLRVIHSVEMCCVFLKRKKKRREKEDGWIISSKTKRPSNQKVSIKSNSIFS